MESRERVAERIVAAFAEFELEADVMRDIAFHMTDWKENLEEMLDLYTRPEGLSDEQVQNIILVFLAHVPNHIAAAKKMIGLGPIEDIFKVGVLEEDQ
jgi:hypothetical protein